MGIEILSAAVFGAAVIYTAGKSLRRGMADCRSYITAAALMLLAALSLRLYLGYFSQGFTTDIDTFKAWANAVNTVGISNVYRSEIFLDYPPGYLYVLLILEKLRCLFGFSSASAAYTLILKLPSVCADLLCGGFLLWLGRKKLGEAGALLLSASYLFCPVVLVNSAQWGQVDSFCTAIFLCSAMLLYKEKYVPSALLFGLSIACKPQMLIFAPMYFFFAIKQKKYLKLELGVLCTVGAVLLTALPCTDGLDFTWLLERYKSTLDYYNYYSVNAYNFWTVIGYNWRTLPAGTLLSVLTLAAPLLATAFCGAFLFLSKRKDALFACPVILMTVMYLFGIKMHERYLFPIFIFLLVCIAFAPDRRMLRAFGTAAVLNYINVAHVLWLFREKGSNYDPNAMLTRMLAAAQLVSLLWLLYVTVSVYVFGKTKEALPKRDRAWEREVVKSDRLTRTDIFAIIAITLVYGVTAFWNLGSHTTAVTAWAPRQGESAVFFSESKFNTVYYLPGIAPDNDHRAARVGANIKVETSVDGEAWADCGNLSDSGTYVFDWSEHLLAAPGNYIRLTCEDESSVLNEIGVKASNAGEFAQLKQLGNGGEALTDEPDTVPMYLTYMNSTYFDEIYHARTAYENLLGLEPYENTHPPLGKYIIAAGIAVFGMNPFGWRFMGTLFGVLMLPVLYHLQKQLFGKSFFCCIGTLLFAFDFMHFTQTRIATIDTYAVFFLLLMYDAMTVFLKRDLQSDGMKKLLPPLLCCGIFTGLGIAAKWTAAYGAVGLAALFFGKLILTMRDASRDGKDLAPLRKKFLKLCLWCCLFFIAIPCGIYFSAYLPLTTLPHNIHDIFGTFINYQKNMFNYHSQLVAEHYFASPWYEWPLDIRPIWYFSGSSVDAVGHYSTISSMGNPLLWWAGIPALAAAAVMWVRERKAYAAVILCGYLSVYLPWVLVPRLTFIYHYFTAVPFMVIALVGMFSKLEETTVGGKELIQIETVRVSAAKLFATAFTAACIVLFCIYYPVISGAPTDKSYSDALRLFSTWYF